MNYFVLHSHCYMQRGTEKSAIYDIFQSRVFWVEEKWKQEFLQQSHDGFSIDDVAEKIGIIPSQAMEYAQLLQNLDLGLIHTAKHANPKYRPFNTKFFMQKNGLFQPLGVVTMELSSSCERQCEGCGSDTLKSMECVCGVYSDTQKITYDVENVIKLLNYTGIQLLLLAGGDPYTNRPDLEKIIATAHAFDIPVKVKAPLMNIRKDDILYLKKYGASLSLVLHDFTDSEQCDSRTLEQFQDLLAICAEAEYTAIDVILSLKSELACHLQDTVKLLNSIHINVASVAIEYRTTPFNASEIQNISKKIFPFNHNKFVVNVDTLPRNLNGHQCWQDSICIMANGDIKPCIAAKEMVLGNLHNAHLLSIIREIRSDTVLNAAKTSEPCSKCEFSLGCFACSVATERIRGECGGVAWDCGYLGG
ncbi:MAG: SPASM domain-containing protein [Defluviitaleaceae bacterium]|nr:SPASM domain-containing protein [Defluviitaleaceae bacterium]